MSLLHEISPLELCWACNTPLAPLANRAYEFAHEGVLCWACAIERGGTYDALHERWSQPPNVADLLDRFEDQ